LLQCSSSPKMKVFALIALALLGLATADNSLLKDAEQLLSRVEELPVQLQKARTNTDVPLRVVLGQPENRELDVLESQIRLKIGQHIRQKLEELLKKLVELGHIAKGEFQRLEDLLKKPFVNVNLEQFIAELFELEGEKEQISQQVRAFLQTDNFNAITLNSFEAYGIGDILDGIVDWLTGLGSWIPDKFDAFKAWAKDIYLTAMKHGGPIIDQIKELAVDFLKNNWEHASKKVIKQALEYFHPYAGILGERIVEHFIQLAKDNGLVPWENPYTTKRPLLN